MKNKIKNENEDGIDQDAAAAYDATTTRVAVNMEAAEEAAEPAARSNSSGSSICISVDYIFIFLLSLLISHFHFSFSHLIFTLSGPQVVVFRNTTFSENLCLNLPDIKRDSSKHSQLFVFARQV